ncbi:uncharacterized protein ACR2FA_003560 [Aphomia sociella]
MTINKAQSQYFFVAGMNLSFVVLFALVAVSQAGLLAEPVHYSSAAAVSSQSIVRHDQPHVTNLVAAPVAKIAVAAPVYHAPAPVYHAPAPVYHAPAPVAYHAPIAKIIAHQPEEIAYPKYEYTYSVADEHSGDNKSQQEVRDGDVVKGSYSFHEADGSIRTVEYTADDHNGFNAVVHNTAPTAAPVAYKAAPLLVKSAPVYFVVLCALVAVSQAGLLAEPVHYSSAAAVSSQSIVRHDQPHVANLVAAPVAKIAVAAPVYHAPAPVYHAHAPVAYHAPIAKVVAHQPEEIAYPKYEYTYSVADGHTGDNKSQQEVRDGDAVKGSYSFHEADGSIRTVEYTADDHNGFNAVVHNTAPTAAPVVYKAAPVLVKSAPVYYHFVALCALVAVSQAGLLPEPIHYSSAAAVSSQSIVRHDQPHATKLVAAPVAKIAVAAPVYHAPAPVYHAPATVYQAPAPIAYHAPIAKVVAHQPEEIAYPKYEYTYSVADGHTGDNKSQQEVRDGDAVKGSYSFHEADGSIRTVEYTADDHNGFNAVVHNTAPTAAPVAYKAAPVLIKSAPVYYHH